VHWSTKTHTHRETSVSWTDPGPWYFTEDINLNNAHGPLDGFFDGYNVYESPSLIFTLLKTTKGLEKGKALSAWQTDDISVKGETTDFTLGWNTWCLKNCSWY